MFTNIDPLLEIAKQARLLNSQAKARDLRQMDVTRLINRRAGLLDAARWLLMAREEQRTGHPVSLLNDSDVETTLGEFISLGSSQG